MSDPATIRTAHNEDVRLAYEVFGPDSGRPLLLIMGLGMQMLVWHDDFCNALVEQGFQVVRMDNRDAGLSSHLDHLGAPALFDMIVRPRWAARYSLGDMAGDAFAVMNDMGWDTANVVGGSLGGMIAQTMAVENPRRVRSLVSIMSSPSARIGRATLRTNMRMAGLMQQPLHSAAEAGRQLIEVYRLIGTPEASYPLDIPWLTETGARSYERAYDPDGKLRQQAAMLAAPDRSTALRKVRIPTVVLHGDADPMIRVEGGIATAAAIPGARLVTMPGVGHGAFPRAVWPAMIDNIAAIAR
ncbi:alpha/beta fold hydrolase [Nocardia sp. NPDC088792]|uniref:alpha/beta fold hydrolase n=1 Tax=Nocardia sp. NPDC088792 TaxID=3364332 RepID=UPI0037F3C348